MLGKPRTVDVVRRRAGRLMRVVGTACLLASGFTVLAAAAEAADPRPSAGDVSARNFEDLCAGSLPASRKERFLAELGRAEAALGRRDLTTAREARSRAWGAAFRGGGETDVSIKCLGRTIAERWFKMRSELDRQAAAVDRERVGRPMLWTTALDGGAPALIARVEAVPAKRFAGVMRSLAGIAEQIENEARFGAFLVPGETRVSEACRAAIPPLEAHAERAHRAALAEERTRFERAPSASERAAVGAIGEAEAFVRSVSGNAGEGKHRRDSLVMHVRVDRSIALLREARWWNLRAAEGPVSSLASSRRAKERALGVRGIGDDASLPATVRARFYADAERYFDFGGFEKEAGEMARAGASLEPAIESDRRRGEAALERLTEGIEADVEATREAVERMQKNDAEKKAFEREADDLEKELGF